MRSAIGNIKNYDLNVKKIYESAEYKNELKTIKKVQCWKNCTHGCNIGLSIQYNKFSLFIIFQEAIKTIFSRFKFIFLKKYDGLG